MRKRSRHKLKGKERTQVCDIPTGRKIIKETEKAFLCDQNVWWPKSQSTSFHGMLVVNDWIWRRKRGEHEEDNG